MKSEQINILMIFKKYFHLNDNNQIKKSQEQFTW